MQAQDNFMGIIKEFYNIKSKIEPQSHMGCLGSSLLACKNI